jgi:ribosomal protein L16/L10AE
VALARNIKKSGKIWIKIFPNKPITKKTIRSKNG